MATEPLILLNGTLADANEVMALFNEIYTNIDQTNVQTANKVGTGRFVLESAVGTLGGVPIGTIIPFYDFNGAVTFSSSFRYCNGAVIVATGSPINGQTLPDLSGRYLVGFGTDGGGDIGSAAWATAAVGNVNHQINIQHSHTVSAHTHDLANHTHAGPSHTHGVGTLKFQTGDQVNSGTNAGYLTSLYDNGGSLQSIMVASLSYDAGAAQALLKGSAAYVGPFYTSNGSGATASGGTGNTGVPSSNTSGSASPATDSQLSTTQSIQPHSIRARYIMRVI